jgi:hypothetical protein
MSKRALLVGINNFIRPDWALRGCINDTVELRYLLITYFGFQDEDVRVLNDGDASAQGIRDGLAWLLSDYDGGDVRVFHFSSHGTQVDDQSGDEWECMDEVIVPYDHDWDNPFRDDDLRAIFEGVPEGVNFTFIADCCHSGTVQKVALEAGLVFTPRFLTPPPEVIARIKALRQQRDADPAGWAADQLVRALRGAPMDQWLQVIRDYIAMLLSYFRENKYGFVSTDRHVLLAACEDRQTAADAQIEGDYRGAFSWALGKAIREANGALTYGQLITRAGAYLGSYEQTPQLECPEQVRDLKVFAPLT